MLIVDDSAIVRKLLSQAIAGEPDIEVIGTAPDPYIARDKILALKPDVLTLDIEMPRMDGLTFLKRLMQHHPLPTIIISSLGQASCSAALEAMRCGAVEVLAKPSGPYSVGDLRSCLAAKIRAAAVASVHKLPATERRNDFSAGDDETRYPAQRLSYHPDTVIALGASTGGTVAIQDILTKLPSGMPGIVITQHIPPGFSLAFANRLNTMSRIEVREARDGDVLYPGLALIAPGDFHLMLRRSGSSYKVELTQGPPVCYQRPSVDVLFASVAQAAGRHGFGALLTGMGSDGAKGLLAMRRQGAHTIAQDEASCVVYGMPREAVKLDAAATIAPLQEISQILVRSIQDDRQVRA